MVDIATARVANYIWNLMTDDEVLTLNVLFERVQRDAGVIVINQNVDQVELLLHRHPFMFFVENGRCARYDPNYHSSRRKAVDYFRSILDSYEEPAYYMNLKGHLGQSEEEVIDFINIFYPRETFKMFFMSYPDNFVVFQNETVLSVEADEEDAPDAEQENDSDVEEEYDDEFEEESVRYFEDVLRNFGDGEHFMRLRGHVGQAPSDIIRFINDNYPGESFLDFLEENNDVFEVSQGNVFLR